jgi:hypothetical protein
MTPHSRGPMSIAMIGPPRELGSLCTQFHRDGPLFVSSWVTVELANVVMSVEVSGRMNTVTMHGEVNDDTNTMMRIEC